MNTKELEGTTKYTKLIKRELVSCVFRTTMPQNLRNLRKIARVIEPQRREERSAAEPQPKGLNKLNGLKELNEKKGGWNFVADCEQVGLLQCREDKKAGSLRSSRLRGLISFIDWFAALLRWVFRGWSSSAWPGRG